MNPDLRSPRPGMVALVVEDEPITQMLVSEILHDMGFDVIGAPNGRAGLNVLESDTRVDLLIADMRPQEEMNGRQLANTARTTRSDLKVLLLTGYPEDVVLKLGPLDADMRILSKPFTVEALADRIGELVLER